MCMLCGLASRDREEYAGFCQTFWRTRKYSLDSFSVYANSLYLSLSLFSSSHPVSPRRYSSLDIFLTVGERQDDFFIFLFSFFSVHPAISRWNILVAVISWLDGASFSLSDLYKLAERVYVVHRSKLAQAVDLSREHPIEEFSFLLHDRCTSDPLSPTLSGVEEL